jgi:hypothetical protein
MSKLPKLKIKFRFGYPGEDICELEQAKYRFDFGGGRVLVVVEGQLMNSYDELVQLAAQDDYKDKEFLEVLLLPAVVGGG